MNYYKLFYNITQKSDKVRNRFLVSGNLDELKDLRVYHAKLIRLLDKVRIKIEREK